MPCDSYPKHVWSPAGGWYAQPKNWRANTAIMGGVIVGICLMVGSVSADREHRTRMPDVRLEKKDPAAYGTTDNDRVQPDRFFPSRYWSREIVEHERAQKAREGPKSALDF